MKGKGRECELTKNMFLNSDLLKSCLKKRHNISEFFPDKNNLQFETSHCKLMR